MLMCTLLFKGGIVCSVVIVVIMDESTYGCMTVCINSEENFAPHYTGTDLT